MVNHSTHDRRERMDSIGAAMNGITKLFIAIRLECEFQSSHRRFPYLSRGAFLTVAAINSKFAERISRVSRAAPSETR